MRIETTNLRASYGRRQALDDVSLMALPGEVLAVVGPNGSGKSTLLRVIAGVHPCGGTVSFEGGPRPSRGIGFMPQDTSSRAALTVFETVLLGRLGRLGYRLTAEDIAATRDVLERLELTALIQRTLGELSGGQRQMVFLAQALAGDPKVLLLDEPISALDVRNQLEVLEIVRSQTKALGLTTLVVLHDLAAAARHSDRIALMSAGKLVASGKPADVLTEDLLAHVFGVRTSRLVDGLGNLVIVPLHAIGASAPA